MLRTPLLAGRSTSSQDAQIEGSIVALPLVDRLLLWERPGRASCGLVPSPQQRDALSGQRTRLTSGRECIPFLSLLRWKRDAAGGKVMQDGKPVLEFVAVKRKDTGDWAIPGVSG